MLRELYIENLAIIEKVDMEFLGGMAVLTGETGAGKSIILDGINMLIGEKVSRDMIRNGADMLSAEGVFDLKEEKIAELNEKGFEIEDEEVIIRRELDESGKSKAWINGKRTTVKELKNLMETVVDIVGQYSHQMLLNSKEHIKLIDKFLKEEDKKIKLEIEVLYSEYKQVERELKEYEKKRAEIREKRDLYEFQLREIDEAKLKEDEDDQLEEEYKILFNAGKIKDKLMSALGFLNGGEFNALSMISKAKSELDSIRNYKDDFEEWTEKLEGLKYELQELLYSMDDTLEELDVDDFRLNDVVARLDKINGLKKKYGISIKNILEYREEISSFLNEVNSGSGSEKGLLQKKKNIMESYLEKSKKISNKRKEISKNIEYNLIEILESLSMKGIKFEIHFEEKNEISKDGLDDIEFLIATNVGEDLKPLASIVSGGEVSRIMLALKTVFSRVDNIPILIFDEIDTGIGGETVRQVSNQLKEISNYSQVITISHTPVIAAKAKEHFFIEKKSVENKTVTTVKKLDYENRVEEISRMIAGENSSDNVRKHAGELLKEGENGL